jgi:peptidoglycan/xylan/chitin deacetylase (PgdA/CDA1 family)
MSWRFGAVLLAAAIGGCIAPSTPSTPSTPVAPAAASPIEVSGPSRQDEATGSAPPHCQWPSGARAAVSLTYDDALASQLRYAAPVLEHHGLKATFFLSGGGLAGFAAQARAGHELASHTLKHPCNADLAALSLQDMAAELDAGSAAVRALGVSGKLTFAYPCGQTRVAGSESYVPLVKQRFRAARGVSPAIADPRSVDLLDVPALFPAPSSDGTDVIEFVERALASGGWAVIGVHGVSEHGEYLRLAQPAHDKIVAYLAEHAPSIWTAPFGAVADVVAACQSSAAGK